MLDIRELYVCLESETNAIVRRGAICHSDSQKDLTVIFLKKLFPLAWLVLILLLIINYWAPAAAYADAPIKVFPEASGFGSETPAGRGGQIIIVTNLNDSGKGSLRDAVQTSGPRIIVFAVGGHIKLVNDLTIAQPFVTIAGQSAPFPGIQISGGRITIQTHDVLLQHLRSRYGDYSGTNNSHALRVISGAYNVVVDHCTLMWADDEVASIWTNKLPIHDVTFSNNIIAEGLGRHGYGTIVGAGYAPPLGANWVNRVSIIRNLYAHNLERNPTVSRDVNAVIINNLCYNAEWEFMVLGVNNGPATVSVIGNHLITGASDSAARGRGGAAIQVAAGGKGSCVYQKDNLLTGRFQRAIFADKTALSTVSSPPLLDDSTILASTAVKSHVLRSAGAWPAQRDSVERRLIAEVRNETGKHKKSITEAEGWPDDYTRMTFRDFTPFIPANPHGDTDGDGYSNIEEVLHKLSEEVENETKIRSKK